MKHFSNLFFLANVLTAALAAFLCTASHAEENNAVELFPEDGQPKDFIVRDWADISKPAPTDAAWEVKDGVLHGSVQRGTWLISEKEYGDFVLEYEFILGPQGNSGCGLRFPLKGDPAFDGLEMQMVDPRYYGDYRAQPIELTGALYKGVAPRANTYKPEEWNTCRISCVASKITITMNGETVLDADLGEYGGTLERGKPLKDRPRTGRIGFQELSRGGSHVQIRNATILEIPGESKQ